MDVRQTIQQRQVFNAAVRAFFAERAYLEAETPTLVASPDSAPTLTPLGVAFKTRDNVTYRGALITSPEYSLKKLVGQGAERVFELARCFRGDEPFDAQHSIEFTMLEWYRSGGTLEDGIEETIALVESLALALRGAATVVVDGNEISVAREAWQIVRIDTLFKEYCGIDSLAEPTKALYRSALDQRNLAWHEEDTCSDLFYRLFYYCIEPYLRTAPHPVLMTHYPAHESALARIDADGFAERFEVFIGGRELCNAYAELTDAHEQRQRFNGEVEMRKEAGQPVYPVDTALIEAVERMPEQVFGNAMGADRLLMFLIGANHIEDVIVFTTEQLFSKNSQEQ